MKKTAPPIIVSVNLDSSKEILWGAITEPAQMKKWFFENIPDFQAHIGFETSFVVENEGRTFTHQWKITEVIPQQSITYSWRYAEYPGDSFVTFVIEEVDGQVRLSVRCDVIEDFPDSIPEFRRESCIGGWEYFLGERLKAYL